MDCVCVVGSVYKGEYFLLERKRKDKRNKEKKNDVKTVDLTQPMNVNQRAEKEKENEREREGSLHRKRIVRFLDTHHPMLASDLFGIIYTMRKRPPMKTIISKALHTRVFQGNVDTKDSLSFFVIMLFLFDDGEKKVFY